VSPVFLDAASSGFGDAFERCAPLDIERPPEAQGFTVGSYDVVLAANVLHATRDLGDSLRHATRLLAPHGVLLLLEAVGRSNWSDLVFGLTPGWWRFADAARRPSHPLLAQPGWQALLAEHFAVVKTVASPGDGQQMLAIAHRPKPERPALVWEAPAGMAPLDLADSALRFVQRALAETRPPALRLVTRGAQRVRDRAIDVDQSVLLGLGRVIAIEHPELDLRLLDLPPGIPAAVADSVPPDVKEAVWRDGIWHSPKLNRISLPQEPVFTTGGTHLVTGGLGGLGPLLGAWLLASGAARVVLMARNTRSDVSLPANVTLVIGDVSRPEEVHRVVQGIGEDLRGVFHLAGTLSDAATLRLTRDDLARVFAAKVEGARNLDVAVGSRTLDAFVLFGSSTGLIGNRGQGAHAAANAYLAAVAQHRQQRGLTGLCVDWGAWGEAGTLTRSSVGDRLVAAGAALMPPADALRGLGRAIVAGKARVLLAAIEWPRFLAGYGNDIPAYFAEVASPRRTAVAPSQGAVNPRASRAALAAFVTNAAERVLGAAAGEALARDAPLNEAGLDSLMALELRKALSVGLEMNLPATLLFNFPTIDSLIEHLAPQVGLAEVQPSPAPLPPQPPPAMAPNTIVENVMRMSEAEMAEVIAREFALMVAGRG
jgi:SAM-dependent methyltransferase